MSDPDVGLMLAFKEGDYDAFGALVERYAKPLVNYFFFQSRDLDLAEDCAQEVWVKVFRARDDYEPRARFSTYLFRVARNFWIDMYRSAARRVTEASLEAEGATQGGDVAPVQLRDRLASPGAGPAAALEDRETVGLISAALASLPEDMREVFLLGEVEGLPYAEVAEILGVPIGTVKSRMFNAVRKLREKLDRGR